MRCRGFTLVELVITLVVLAILALGISSYIGLGARMYSDAAEREQVLGQSRFVAERMVRELRNAVPNSIAEESTGSLARTCLIFRPILFSGIYTKLPHTEKDTSIEVISPGLTNADSGTLLVVYPTKPADFALTGQGPGKAVVINKIELIDSDTAHFKLSFSDSFQFSHQSPEQRFYIAGDEVRYCAMRMGTDAKIYRNGVLMAEGLVLTFNSNSGAPVFMPPVFSVDNPTLTRNSVVNIFLQFGYGGNADMFFNYEVHIPNVP